MPGINNVQFCVFILQVKNNIDTIFLHNHVDASLVFYTNMWVLPRKIEVEFRKFSTSINPSGHKTQ